MSQEVVKYVQTETSKVICTLGTRARFSKGPLSERVLAGYDSFFIGNKSGPTGTGKGAKENMYNERL